VQPRHVLRLLDQVHAAGTLAHGALDLGMTAVADHDDLATMLAHLCDLDVHLGHEGTGCIEHFELARLGIAPHLLGHAVRAEDHRGAFRHLREVLDEHRAFLPQVLDHELVVHDLVAHVDRSAVQAQRTLDDFDGAIDAGTETTGVGEQDLHQPIIANRRGASV